MSQVVIGGASLVVAAPKVPVFFCKRNAPALTEWCNKSEMFLFIRTFDLLSLLGFFNGTY